MYLIYIYIFTLPETGTKRKQVQTTLSMGKCTSETVKGINKTTSNKGEDDVEKETEFSWRLLDPNFHFAIYTHAQANAIFDVMEEVMPSYVVLYDPDITLLRNIEVYQANHPKEKLKVYFLIYGPFMITLLWYTSTWI